MELGIPGVEDPVRIGAGGAAVVYLARESGRRVAVKVFAADEHPRRVERERLAAAAMADDDGVVAVERWGVTTDGRQYLLMPFMPGGSLADRVRRGGPLPAARTAEIGLRLAAVVGEAHRRGIRHRDIKPQNILFDADDRPRLSDFGIADLGAHAFETADGTLTGTVPYMAPELIRGEPDAEPADVYSLGASLYFAVEGRPVFEARPGEAYEAMVVRRASSPDPVTFTAATPPWLRRVLLRALVDDPGQRPTTEQFAAALRTAGGSALRSWPARRRAAAQAGWAQPDVGRARAARWPPPPAAARRPPGGPTPRPGTGARTAGLVVALVAAAGLVLTGVGMADGPGPPTGARSDAAPVGPLPDATWQKVDPRTALADLDAFRAASGQADPSAGVVVFRLWAPDTGAERSSAWLARPGQQRIGVLYRMVDGELRRTEVPARYRVFPLSSVRIDLLSGLVREAREGCRRWAPRADASRVTVDLRDPRSDLPVISVQLLDPRNGRLATVDFAADGRRKPDQPCVFG